MDNQPTGPPSSEVRRDPIVGRRVIVAPERGLRPRAFAVGTVRPDEDAAVGDVPGPQDACPFCEGNEQLTPPETFALRPPGSPPNAANWRVRVVPNKYPALTLADLTDHAASDLFERSPGAGVHEVIVESPRHLCRFAELSVDNVQDVLIGYRQRLAEVGADGRLAYGLIFKNAGTAAGATIEHVHSQLIATPFVPGVVAEELAAVQRACAEGGRCPFCEMVERETASGKRLVLDEGGFVAFCPFASRQPLETWILPKAHESRFERQSPQSLRRLAEALCRVLGAIERAVGQPAYNYVLHTAPWEQARFDTGTGNHYHWHLEIVPRTTSVAGFEWGTGVYINTVSPEHAARRLRTLVAGSGRSSSL